MKPNVNSTIKTLLNDKLIKLETYLEADIFSYYGNMIDGLENDIVNIFEDLGQDENKRDRLVVILTTPGGSSFAVERYVNIIRHHYKIVDFFVPNYAYSAGTIFCMSGDNIYMDYSSVVGPIDPQVQNREGKYVPALGYLDKVNDAIQKSNNKTLTEAEYLMIKDLDLAELRSYEQASELTIELLKKWLVNFKFKDWNVHQTTPELIGQPVTPEQKVQKAELIASKLNNSAIWKSHNRPINMTTLRELGLKIEDFSQVGDLRNLLRDYYDLFYDYVTTNKLSIFVHTRKFV